MTEFQIRTSTAQPVSGPMTHLLDWLPGRPAATIQLGEHGPDFFSGWRPPRAAADLMLLGASAYCADKITRRHTTPDAWTRSIELRLPVADAESWQRAAPAPVLDFLTGDRWSLRPVDEPQHPLDDLGVDHQQRLHGIDAVCLFSGGLDSLCGAIDLLEEDPRRRLCLVSHHEGGQTSTAQLSLLDALTAHYGSDRVLPRRLFLRPAPPNGHQTRPLPRGREPTTRSRSLLFLSTALAVAAAVGPAVPVHVPENGFIGINVPLTRARAGTASTRTTHPHFMAGIQAVAATVGVTNPVRNPYRLLTKGEMLARCRNRALLQRLAPSSVSCSHPENARWVGRDQGNCGYCFPCLIRRASLAHVGWDTETYAWDALADPDLLDPHRQRGADLRAVVAGVTAARPDRDALTNGPLPAGERAAFVGVWRRGLTELRGWLAGGASGELAAVLADQIL